jgi:hypothetical protein
MLVTTIDDGVSSVRREWLASVLELVATAHLLFPVAIILCAVAGFFVGIAIHPLVLPLAAVLAIVGLRTLGSLWRDVAGIVGIAVITHLAAGAIAYEFPDNSWDGLGYQQEAVVRLAAGWNPVTESANRYGVVEELYLDHYPKASWITAAAVLKTTGHIEAGKLFNLTLMFAAACLCLSALLRLTLLPIAWAAAVSVLIALNPVFVYQGTTFYVDNLVASTLTVIVAGLVVFIAARRRQALVVAMLAALIAINLKFTGLIYTAILFGLAALVVWRQYGLPAASRYAATAAAAGIVGAVALGYAPYVHNLVDHHDPFYPATPKHGLLDTTNQVPANLLHADRVSRFLVSSFSRSEPVRPPQGTRAKFPLSIGPQERRGLYSADLESGGFGPLYGALLLLAGVAAVTLCINRSSRRVAGVVLLIAGCVLATIFVHRETWWARYIPQAWLLPMLIAIPSLCAPRRSVQWWLGSGLVGLAVVNLSVVSANVGWRQLKYARDIRVALQQMSSTAPPVTVYLGPFRSLRQRLTEARIDFRMIETPADSGVTGHARNAIPTPGNVAFWLDAQPKQGSSR